jgi:anthranilate/para-aminobenzoate synthase component I
VHIQSGAGLVADSVPESEYEETVNKVRINIFEPEPVEM